jgi:hypothetical protein
MTMPPQGDDAVTGEQRGAVALHGRRADDLTLHDIWKMIRRARWIGAFALVVGTGGGWIGGQMLGPVARRVATVDGKVVIVDSLHTIQFNSLRAEDARLTERINDLADQTRLTSYLICTWTRRNDPAAVPAECNQVILDWRRR